MNLQVLFLLAAMLATESVAERQTFDTALAATNGGWVSGNLPYNNSDFGFKNSGNAGGPAGEMGGAIYREAKVSYYADTTINSNLNANAALSATGTFYGVNNDYNGDFCIGWFNKSAGGGTSLPRFVGLQFSEGSDFRFRAASGLSGALSNSATGTILENTVYGWQIIYDPNGGVTGRVSVTIGGTTRTYDLTTFERNAVATFDAFGLFTLPLSDSASDCRAYFDSLEYTTGASASSVMRNVGPGDITQTSASLNGELMSTGAPPWTVYVAWGGADAGTNMTWANWQNLGAPETGTLVYVANTLTPDTAYYYTFLASNANEMAWAVPSARFTTALGTGAVPGNLAASALNGCQVRLTWVDHSVTETGFIVEKSTNGVFWTAGAVSGANATNITVSGLRRDTPYWFRVRATNDVSVSAPSVAATAQTGSSLPAAITNSLGLVFARIDPGTFTMGVRNDPEIEDHLDANYVGDDYDEQPGHTVRISKAFYLLTSVVSNGVYAQSGLPGAAADASWEHAEAFCEWMSAREGSTCRLPTEAEWDYAFRNPGSLQGLGDTWEWTRDWHAPFVFINDGGNDPAGPVSGMLKVARKDGSNRKALSVNAAYDPWQLGGTPAVRFRVVMEVDPVEWRWTPPPFCQAGIKQGTNAATLGPNPAAPYFTVRFALPLPPDNSENGKASYLGCDPATIYHNHSPGLEIMPNGDVLAVWFSAATPNTEAGQDTRFVQARLRHGADQWDMPELFYDMKDMNDQSGLLWRENGTVRFFGGGKPTLGDERRPFEMAVSTNNGATWDLRRPTFPSPVANTYSPQPIVNAFRAGGLLYMACDAQVGANQSLLWESPDNGMTWFDTGGRTTGRHSTILPKLDGSTFYCLGGKYASLGGYMPQQTSVDKGRSWSATTTTPFAPLVYNQRASMIRLKNGNLAVCSDAQDRNGVKPPSSYALGVIVGISTNDGQTWTIKNLPVSLVHESERDYGTLGYSTIRQGPNGVIHVLSTMTTPCLHYEFNEAWFWSSDGDTLPETTGGVVNAYAEYYPGGQLRQAWSARTCPNGRYLLEGTNVSYYADGTEEWRACYDKGKKTGRETFRAPDGTRLWTWEHGANSSKWIHWWPDGLKRVESTWNTDPAAPDLPARHFSGLMAHGNAYHWDRQGLATDAVLFTNGVNAGATSLPSSQAKTADLNDDGALDSGDEAVFGAQLGWIGLAGGYNVADFDFDGDVDSADEAIFQLLLAAQPAPPVIHNGTGATNITFTTATLQGTLVSDGGFPTECFVYWGLANGGTNSTNWSHCAPLGVIPTGVFSTNVSGLVAAQTYYYRCAASNSVGKYWATTNAQFQTLSNVVSTAVTNGLVLWWKFDETNGASAADSSSNGRTGTLRNMGDGSHVPGVFGNALAFDGVNDDVDCASVGSTLVGDVTVSLWVRYAAASGNRILELAAASGAGLQVRGGVGGEVGWDNSGGPSAETFSTRILNDTIWHHVAIVRKGSTGQMYHLYIDGVADKTGAGTVVSYTRLFVGKGASSTNWAGQVDDVRIYGRALATNEIVALAAGDERPADTDMNGMADEWERGYFGGLAMSKGGPNDDWDEDGVPNLSEYIAGTNPTNPASFLSLNVGLNQSMIVLQWQTIMTDGPGYGNILRYYDLEKSFALLPVHWSGVPDATNLPGNNQMLIWTNQNIETSAFYRVRVRLQ